VTDIKPTKARKPKVTKPKESLVEQAETVAEHVEPVAEPIVTDIKPTKTRKPKVIKPKETVVEQAEQVAEPIKKRGTKGKPKSSTNIDNTNTDHENDHEDKRPSDYTQNDVIIPHHELSLLNSLVEETCETSLTEIFVDNILFYKDEHNNWFDLNLYSITDPTLDI
jgi:hypothetical protein